MFETKEKINQFHEKIHLQFFAEGGEGGEGGGEGGAGSEGNPSPKTFTQEEVNGMMAAEKRSGRLSLLKELGYEVKDGKYKETVAIVKGILDSGKSQQQLDQEALSKAQGDLATEQAKSKSLQAQIDVMSAGVKPEFVMDALSMLLPQVTEEKPLASLLEDYKQKYPVWFSAPPKSQGTGGPNNPPRKDGSNKEGLGQRLAKTGKTATKSSYFKN